MTPLVTVTDTRQTSRKFVVNFFPKEITLWPGQDSNPGPSAPDPDALTTRSQMKIELKVDFLDVEVWY